MGTAEREEKDTLYALYKTAILLLWQNTDLKVEYYTSESNAPSDDSLLLLCTGMRVEIGLDSKTKD